MKDTFLPHLLHDRGLDGRVSLLIITDVRPNHKYHLDNDRETMVEVNYGCQKERGEWTI